MSQMRSDEEWGFIAVTDLSAHQKAQKAAGTLSESAGVHSGLREMLFTPPASLLARFSPCLFLPSRSIG